MAADSALFPLAYVASLSTYLFGEALLSVHCEAWCS